MMNVLSIIPARGGSQGITGKNLILINKKKLLAYTVEASLNSSLVTKTVVSTDDSKIAIAAKLMGAEVIIRPKNLSGNKIGLEPAILHVLKTLKINQNYIPDIIVILQNTSPLRNSKHIDEALTKFKKRKYDSLISGYTPKEFLWKSKNQGIVPVNYNPTKRPNRQEIKNQFLENGAIYIIKLKTFEKNTKSRIGGKVGVYIMSRKQSIQIDEPYDLIMADALLKMKNYGKK